MRTKKIKSTSVKVVEKIKSKRKLLIQIVSVVVVGVIFYSVGVGVGDGRLQFGHGSIVSLNTNSDQGLPAGLNYADIQQEYNILKLNFDGTLTDSNLQDSTMNGMVQATGDPFTDYFNASQAAAFTNELNNTFSGIGAVLGANSKGQLEIISPLNGYPAAKAGLQPQDVIISINGKSTSGLDADTAAADIRGKNGTVVTLVIERDGKQMTYNITRETITAPSVQSSIINGNIGYIQISSFANDTAGLTQTAANNFKSKGVKSIILDLRDNPGGLVSAAVSVSSLWLPSGNTIMIQKHDNQVVQTYQSTGNDILKGIPTVVLINGGSASASEITASALHDNHAATLIGTKSYGKGTEQQIFPLNNGGELKVTIAHWFTPDNKSIEHQGIQPDMVVNEPSSDQSNGVDDQKNAAIQYLQSHS